VLVRFFVVVSCALLQAGMLRAVSLRKGGAEGDGLLPPRFAALLQNKAGIKLILPDSNNLDDVIVSVQDTARRRTQPNPEWRDSPFDITRRSFRESPLYLNNPKNVELQYELTPDGKGYAVFERVGKRNVRPPTYITLEEYKRTVYQRQVQEYFREKANVSSAARGGASSTGLIPAINVNSALFRDIFGSGRIDIKPNVTALLDLSLRTNETLNPALAPQQQRNSFFDFRQRIQLNVTGQVGERLRFRANYDTDATYNFENQFKVEYVGLEDDVVKKIELGNVSMPINGSLITGGQNLWGLKMQMQFGPVWLTMLGSQQRGRSNEIVIRNGVAQIEINKRASEYDDQRHFFLSQFFRSKYEEALRNLPLNQSRIRITRIELYVTNRAGASTSNNRNAVGFIDLGEGITGGNRQRLFNKVTAGVIDTTAIADSLPNNAVNGLYGNLPQNNAAPARDRSSAVAALRSLFGYTDTDGIGDFEMVENMRLLRRDQDYYLNDTLGYVMLNNKLQNNDALFVAFEYTTTDRTGNLKVGEFQIDRPADPTNSNVLYLKMLKPSAVRPRFNIPKTNTPDAYPAWDLMMKNVYSLNAFNVQPTNFRLDVVYEATDGSGDINYLPATKVKSRPLIQVVRLDQLTNNNERGPDNRFDFLPGRTIYPDRGLIIFPVLEPFGQTLIRQMRDTTTFVADTAQFTYDQLYRLTQVDARQSQFQAKDRYKMKGFYSSSAGGDIQIPAVQLVAGSVRVTANGVPLNEGSDYSVDYQSGRVSILAAGIRSSGQEIRISFESNQLFGIDQKTLVGARIDYRGSKKFTLGSTIMWLHEQPLINKVLIGEEPMSNVIWGLDGTVNVQSKWLTHMLDKLPFYSTNTPSDISFQGEFAQLLPGYPAAIANGPEKGIAYVDDFEAAQSYIDLTGGVAESWKLASTPLSLLPAPSPDTLASGKRRAKLAWYAITPLAYDRPGDFGFNGIPTALTGNAVRRVTISELFPNRTTGVLNYIQTFDLRYQPSVRGPYNYETIGLNADGTFASPTANWGGIMRLTTGNTDFEAANFEFIDMWVMDPYIDNPAHAGGDMYINLGRVSEDVLTDGQRAYENGLPTGVEAVPTTRNTTWGRVPTLQVVNNAFANDAGARVFQDVGLDGLNDEDERRFFSRYIDTLRSILSQEALLRIEQDPSGDNFKFFQSADYGPGTDLLTRYQDFNGQQGNSPAQSGGGISQSNYQTPDVEDLNRDNSLNQQEAYYEYKISMRPTDLVVGTNHIIDKRDQVLTVNNLPVTSRWYLFRIPLRDSARVARGGIQDLKAVDFIRMYLTGFNREVVVRMGQFRIISTQWRSYNENPDSPLGNLGTQIQVATVNIEENNTKTPYPYVVPPGIVRQNQPASPVPNQLQNEQALQIRVLNLQDGDARGAFKVMGNDLRFYERIKMWVHAEGITPNTPDNMGDARVFMRLGSDFTSNYYEYEIPITPSQPGNSAPENIWPEVMQFDVAMDALTSVKVQRDNAGASRTLPFEVTDGTTGNKITVRGTPQLSNLKVIMIGVKNPAGGGQPVNVEIWANELRTTNFNLTPGWAASGRLNVKLADLGQFSVSGRYTTPGFGSVQSRVGERSLEWRTQYKLDVNLQLGKLLPKKAGLEIPLYFMYREAIIEPKYNPFDPDVNLRQQLSQIQTEKADSLRNLAIDYTREYNYSVSNLRRVRQKQGAKERIWDIENFAFSYAFSEIFMRTPQLQKRLAQNYSGGFTWTYNLNPKSFQPFKGIGKGTTLLNAFNFTLLPRSIAYSITGNRIFEEEQLRQVSPTNVVRLPATYNQNFTISQTFNLRWELAKSIGITYSFNSLSRIDEPRGPINTREKSDSIWKQVLSFGYDPERGKYSWINFGRTLNFSQQLAITYRLPFDKIKYLNWINSSAAYTGDFRWNTAAQQFRKLGNTIGNGQNIQLSNQLNMTQLYKKLFPKLEAWLRPIPRLTAYSLADSTRRRGDNLEVASKNLGKFFAGMLFSLKNIDVQYSENRGTTLPGYLPVTNLFGMDMGYRNPRDGSVQPGPGWDFVFGLQPDFSYGDKGWLGRARERGWLSTDPNMVTPFNQTWGHQLGIRTGFELFKGFRIDVKANRQKTENNSAVYRIDSLTNTLSLTNPQAAGSYSISFMSIGTAWSGGSAFDQLEQNRRTISTRLAGANPNYNNPIPGEFTPGIRPDDFFNGYTGSQAEVLTGAFLSAYGPYTPSTIALTPFQAIPWPNWTVNWSGLSDVWWLKDFVQTITFTHGYNSTYSVNYQYNQRFDLRGSSNAPGVVLPLSSLGAGTAIDPKNVNFEAQYNIQSLVINESFTPLIGINIQFLNGITTVFDYKQSRQMALNLGALQLTELNNTEFTLNLQWQRKRGLPPINLFGRLFEVRNSLTLRMEVTIRDTKTQNRYLDAVRPPEPTAGTLTQTYKPSVDYNINTQLTARAYFEYTRNTPALSTSFPTVFWAFGVQVRFTLQ